MWFGDLELAALNLDMADVERSERREKRLLDPETLPVPCLVWKGLRGLGPLPSSQASSQHGSRNPDLVFLLPFRGGFWILSKKVRYFDGKEKHKGSHAGRTA